MARWMLISLCLILGACEASSPQTRGLPAPPDPADPCELMTARDIESAVGFGVSPGRETASRPDARGHTTPLCLYRMAGAYRSLTVSLRDGVSSAEFARDMRRDPLNTQRVDGAGDAAFIHGCVAMQTRRGALVVGLSLQHLDTCEEAAGVLRSVGMVAVQEAAERS